jgi:hypothetical protein
MAEDQEPSGSRQVNRGRRRFLGAVGASALAVAASTFGRSTPAFASNYGCCNLAHPPGDPNYIGWYPCYQRAAYIWNCHLTRLDCACCETSGNAQSGAVCSRSG